MNECPICSGQIRETKETQQFAYRDGERDVLLTAEPPVYTCDDCGEQFLSSDGEAIQHEAICQYLGRLSPKEIKGLRKAAKINQRQLAEMTGIGLASIKRWETGKLIQSSAMDKVLRSIKEGPVVVQRSRFQPVFRTKLQQRSMEEAKHFELRLSP